MIAHLRVGLCIPKFSKMPYVVIDYCSSGSQPFYINSLIVWVEWFLNPFFLFFFKLAFAREIDPFPWHHLQIDFGLN